MNEEQIKVRANYTVEEWLAIFKESETTRCEWNDDEPPMCPFELAVSEVLDMANYSNYPDYYWGFVFFETLRLVTSSYHNEHAVRLELKVVDLEEFLPEPFNMLYLAMINMEPFKGCLNWGTSIRGAWYDFDDFSKLNKGLNLSSGYLQLNGEQISPCIKTKEAMKVFHAALLKYYDNYLIELGPDKLARIKDTVYNKSFNMMDGNDFLTDAYIAEHCQEE